MRVMRKSQRINQKSTIQADSSYTVTANSERCAVMNEFNIQLNDDEQLAFEKNIKAGVYKHLQSNGKLIFS